MTNNHHHHFFYFKEKYDIVGRLLKPGERPSVYPTEETTIDGGYNLSDKKRE
jgi:hypothetical protein